MAYIAAVSSKHKEVQLVKNQLLETNPLLEAFGNAKTLRNNNSSRFGKYMSISFECQDPNGANILTYLLEKHRVIERQEGERSFHIFYFLLYGANDKERQYCGLSASPDHYEYLSNSKCFKVPGMDDQREFAHVKRAMEVIGIDENEQMAIFQLLTLILNLGNISFDGGRRGSISSEISADSADSMTLCSHFFGLQSPEILRENLTQRSIRSGQENIMSDLNVQQANYARDSLAKGIYSRLFNYIVERCNSAMRSDTYTNTYSILDIYGFEIFQSNSLEQLFINYTNERLHQLYTESQLIKEQEEYKAEGIKWENVSYFDNKPVVELIENRGHLFALLDEESIFPKGNDSTLHTKLSSMLQNHKSFQSLPPSKQQGSAAGSFVIRHYAGSVQYSCEGMLDKNKDLLFPNLVKMCFESNNQLLQSLFEADFHRLKDDKKRPITSCVQFKTDINSLISTLNQCRQHFVRTIKPNEAKAPGQFDKDRVMEQIRYLGLLENTKVRRAGYAHRYPYELFLAKYKSVIPMNQPQIHWNDDPREATKRILTNFGFADFQEGKTKIFIKSPKTLFALEDLRTAFLDNAANKLTEFKEEQFIYADRVTGYEQKVSSLKKDQQPGENVEMISTEYILILSSHSVSLFNPVLSKLIRIPLNEVSALTTGALNNPQADGFLIVHCIERDRQTQEVTGSYDILVENVLKSEISLVSEALHNYGVELEIRGSDRIPQPRDSNFLVKRPEKATSVKTKKGRCVVM
jgi:myosin-1